jgi:aminomethyltransferase
LGRQSPKCAAYDGEEVGEVTSGIHSPSLQQGVGMAYVAVESAKKGTGIEVMIRDRAIPAEIVRPPFYTTGSLRR